MPRPVLPDDLRQLIAPLFDTQIRVANSSGGGTGGGDRTTPGVPSGLTLAGTLVRNFTGQDTVTVTASWTAPAAVNDRMVSGVSQYGVSYRLGGAGDWSAELRVPATGASMSAQLPGLPTATLVEVRVRAITRTGSASAYVTASLTTASDTTPPTKPTVPAVASALGAVKVTWDGLLRTPDDTGTQAVPSDFARVEVHTAASGTFTPSATTKHSDLAAAGTATVPVELGTSVFARLVAVDTSGNASGPSDAAGPISPGSVASAVGQIGGANGVVNSSFEADSNADGIPDEWTRQGSTAFTIDTTRKRGPFGTKSWKLDYTRPGTETTTIGVYGQSAAVVCVPGRPFLPSAWVWIDALHTAGTVQIALRFLDSASAVIGSPTYFSADMTVRDGWQRLVGSAVVAPSTAAYWQMYAPSVSVAPSERALLWVDDVQVDEGEVATAYAPRPQELNPGSITQTEIADDSVTSGKIVAGAVVAGKIAADAVTATEIAAGAVVADKVATGAVTAAKIAAGALTADKISTSTLAAGVIITAGTPGSNRVEISDAGVKLIQGASTVRVNLDVAAGSGTFSGTVTSASIQSSDITSSSTISGATITGSLFRTASSGSRIQINQPVSGRHVVQAFNSSGTAKGGLWWDGTSLYLSGTRSQVSSAATPVYIDGDFIDITTGAGSLYLKSPGFPTYMDKTIVAENGTGYSRWMTDTNGAMVLVPTNGGSSTTVGVFSATNIGGALRSMHCSTIYRDSEATNSARELKTDITDAPDAPGIEALRALRLRRFRYLPEITGNTDLRVGVIRDEVPSIFHTRPDDPDDVTVNDTAIRWAMLRAIQQLDARLSALEPQLPVTSGA